MKQRKWTKALSCFLMNSHQKDVQNTPSRLRNHTKIPGRFRLTRAGPSAFTSQGRRWRFQRLPLPFSAGKHWASIVVASPITSISISTHIFPPNYPLFKPPLFEDPKLYHPNHRNTDQITVPATALTPFEMTKCGSNNTPSSLSTLLPRLIDIIIFQRLQDIADVRVGDVWIVISAFVVLTAVLITWTLTATRFQLKPERVFPAGFILALLAVFSSY